MEEKPARTRADEVDIRYAQRISGPLMDFDLNGELESLRASDSYHMSNHAAVTLVKRSGMRVVLIAMRAGGLMEEHHAPSPITVQVLHGRVRFEVEGGGLEMTAGRLIALDEGIPHRVVGIEEGAFVLTIGG